MSGRPLFVPLLLALTLGPAGAARAAGLGGPLSDMLKLSLDLESGRITMQEFTQKSMETRSRISAGGAPQNQEQADLTAEAQAGAAPQGSPSPEGAAEQGAVR